MDIKDIFSVGLSAEDFDVLLEGLDALPEKGMAELVMEGMIAIMEETILSPGLTGEMAQELKKNVEEFQNNMIGRGEDLIVLKSKLILLKRLLSGNEAVKIANDILHSTPPGPGTSD